MSTPSATLYSEAEGQGPDVVILHGLMGSCENWRTVRHALAPSYRVTCLDLPNHGRSPRQDTFDIPSMADDVLAAMDRLGIRRAAIVGHSLGGRVAMCAACANPERVTNLIIVDMTVKAFRPVHLFVLRACRDLPLARFTRRAELKAELLKSVLYEETCDFLLKNIDRKSDGSFAWRVPLDALINNYATVSDAPPLAAPYHGPCTFILGGKSPFRVMRDETEIRAWFPRARFDIIPGAGHLVHVDSPQAFLVSLTSALKQ